MSLDIQLVVCWARALVTKPGGPYLLIDTVSLSLFALSKSVNKEVRELFLILTHFREEMYIDQWEGP